MSVRRGARAQKDPIRREEHRVVRGATPCWILQRVWDYSAALGSTRPPTIMFRTERRLLSKKAADAETFDTQADADAVRLTLRWPTQWVAVEYTAEDAPRG